MSLINDALKRAKENQQGQPLQASLNSPMEPVLPAAKSHLPLIVGGALCLVFIIAGVFFWMMAGASRKTTGSSPVRTAAVAPVTAPRTNALAPVAKAPVASVAPSNPAPFAVVRPTPAVQVAKPAPVAPAPIAKPVPVVATPAPAPVVAAAVPSKPVVTPSAAPATPIVPAAEKVVSANFPDLKLKAIAYNATRPVAVINNASLTLGDEISGARLIKIEPRKVTLKWNNQIRELLLD